MQTITSTNTPKVVTRITVTIERLEEIIKIFKVAEGNALPCQEIDLEVVPGVVFTYDPKVPTFSHQADIMRKPRVTLPDVPLDPKESMREGQLLS